MLKMTAEDQTKLEASLNESAAILRKYTEPEKLQNFESIEVELRGQLLEIVGPKIGEFFFLKAASEAAREKEQ